MEESQQGIVLECHTFYLIICLLEKAVKLRYHRSIIRATHKLLNQ